MAYSKHTRAHAWQGGSPREGGVQITPVCLLRWGSCSSYLSTKTIQGPSLALEGIDHIECGDSLAAGVLGVGDGVTNHVLKEHLEDSASLLVDESTDTLDATTASQTPDGRLCDTCKHSSRNFSKKVNLKESGERFWLIIIDLLLQKTRRIYSQKV